MKKLILAALLGAALATGGLLGKAKLDDAALNEASLKASQEDPVCLRNEDASEVVVILESDAEAKQYRGLRIIMGMFQLSLETSARKINERKDLRKIDCRTGQ